MAETHDQQSAIKKLGELIHSIEVAMMTTIEADGSLRSRPMATQKAEFDGTLWFFTRAGAPKVGEVEQDRHVNLSYSDVSHQKYVSVSGIARPSRDPAKIRDLWHPALKAWFPEGLDDPELSLLGVEVRKAEYWDTPSSAVVHLVGFLKAIVTGESYQPGDHEKVKL